MQKADTPPKALGYLRVSTALQVREGESLAVQKELIQAICRLEGLDLAEIFTEEGISGSRPFAQRPVGQKLLAAVKPGDTVVALRLDRMFRDTADALATLAAFKRQGIKLYLRDLGGYISGDSVGELVFTMMSSVASFERSRTRERILEVRASMRNQGRFMGGDVPFAHRLVEEDGKAYIEVDPVMHDEIVTLKRKDYSTRLIAGHFAQRGVKVSHHAVARYIRRVAI